MKVRTSGVNYMVLNETDATANNFEWWSEAIEYIDYILDKTETWSMVLFEMVDGKIINGMRYTADGRSEVVL